MGLVRTLSQLETNSPTDPPLSARYCDWLVRPIRLGINFLEKKASPDPGGVALGKNLYFIQKVTTLTLLQSDRPFGPRVLILRLGSRNTLEYEGVPPCFWRQQFMIRHCVVLVRRVNAAASWFVRASAITQFHKFFDAELLLISSKDEVTVCAFIIFAFRFKHHVIGVATIATTT
jgi:hypothetical protein